MSEKSPKTRTSHMLRAPVHSHRPRYRAGARARPPCVVAQAAGQRRSALVDAGAPLLRPQRRAQPRATHRSTAERGSSRCSSLASASTTSRRALELLATAVAKSGTTRPAVAAAKLRRSPLAHAAAPPASGSLLLQPTRNSRASSATAGDQSPPQPGSMATASRVDRPVLRSTSASHRCARRSAASAALSTTNGREPTDDWPSRQRVSAFRHVAVSREERECIACTRR